jgi:hypothetical protein
VGEELQLSRGAAGEEAIHLLGVSSSNNKKASKHMLRKRRIV